MSKKLLTDDTVIDPGQAVSAEYIKYFKKALGAEYTMHIANVNYKYLWDNHTGKTLKQIADACKDGTIHMVQKQETKDMTGILSEERFRIISDNDKAFLIAFDKAMNELGYDFGGGIGIGYCWGKYMIIYGKTGTKSRPCPARIYIKDDGAIQLRLFLNKVDKHRDFIENAPAHIKSAFVFKDGECKSCNTMCAPGKVYTIDGKTMRKCNHSVFYFAEPSVERLPDIMTLLSKFYPARKAKQANPT